MLSYSSEPYLDYLAQAKEGDPAGHFFFYRLTLFIQFLLKETRI